MLSNFGSDLMMGENKLKFFPYFFEKNLEMSKI